MKQRNISHEDIVKAVQADAHWAVDRLGHNVSTTDIDRRTLRVFFVRRGEDIVIISAYKSSKSKYKER